MTERIICLWCYNGFMRRETMTLDTFAAACAAMGLKSVELVGPDQWPVLTRHGLICAMTPSHGIAKGLNRLENHGECLASIRKSIDAMMKEDVLFDIRKHADCWGHYHTGGVPGRNEIDGTQTLDYAGLMRAIIDTGFTGYVGQEFVPKRPDALASLRQAVAICDTHR
jgi:sugar phosphate isomerase/epimerase